MLIESERRWRRQPSESQMKQWRQIARRPISKWKLFAKECDSKRQKRNKNETKNFKKKKFLFAFIKKFRIQSSFFSLRFFARECFKDKVETGEQAKVMYETDFRLMRIEPKIVRSFTHFNFHCSQKHTAIIDATASQVARAFRFYFAFATVTREAENLNHDWNCHKNEDEDDNNGSKVWHKRRSMKRREVAAPAKWMRK